MLPSPTQMSSQVWPSLKVGKLAFLSLQFCDCFMTPICYKETRNHRCEPMSNFQSPRRSITLASKCPKSMDFGHFFKKKLLCVWCKGARQKHFQIKPKYLRKQTPGKVTWAMQEQPTSRYWPRLPVKGPGPMGG